MEPRWRTIAKAEKAGMDTLISALPLAEAVIKCSSKVDSARPMLRMGLIETGRRKERTLILGDDDSGVTISASEFMEMMHRIGMKKSVEVRENALAVWDVVQTLAEIKYGATISQEDAKDEIKAEIARIIGMTPIPQDFVVEKPDGGVKGILTLNAEYYETINKIGKHGKWIVDDLKMKFGHMEGEGEAKVLRDICNGLIAGCTLMFMSAVWRALDKNERGMLDILLMKGGIEQAKKIRKLRVRIKEERNQKKAVALKRELCGLLFKEAKGELGAQSEPEPYGEERNGRIEKQNTVAEMMELKARFPRLYDEMMDSGKKRDDATRALKKMVRELNVAGVPSGFIREAMRKGIRDKVGIEHLYLEKLEKEGKPHTIVIKKLAPPRILMKEKAAEGKKKKMLMNHEQLMASIKFPKEAEDFLAERGFTTLDVVKALCKGFDFGKGKPAVGNAHVRGANIRNNLRRCCEGHAPDEILGLFRDLGVLHEFGSSKSTKTKDEAMSVELNPTNPIGKQIIDAMQAAFVEFKRNGGDGKDTN